jgi:hypothetical protein
MTLVLILLKLPLLGRKMFHCTNLWKLNPTMKVLSLIETWHMIFFYRGPFWNIFYLQLIFNLNNFAKKYRIDCEYLTGFICHIVVRTYTRNVVANLGAKTFRYDHFFTLFLKGAVTTYFYHVVTFVTNLYLETYLTNDRLPDVNPT